MSSQHPFEKVNLLVQISQVNKLLGSVSASFIAANREKLCFESFQKLNALLCRTRCQQFLAEIVSIVVDHNLG